MKTYTKLLLAVSTSALLGLSTAYAEGVVSAVGEGATHIVGGTVDVTKQAVDDTGHVIHNVVQPVVY